MDVKKLKRQLTSKGISVNELAKLAGCSKSSMYRWATGRGKVPWGAIERIGAAAGLSPESLATKPKVFDPSKFNHYLTQRGASLEKLLSTGRFRPYSHTAIYGWLRGTREPTSDAMRVLELGLDLPLDALTDGPLAQVPVFSPVELEQWSDPSSSQAGVPTPEPPTIREAFRSWRERQGLSWSQVCMMVPGNSAGTVSGWMCGIMEPSERGVAVLEKAMGLTPGSLVKRHKPRVVPSVAAAVPSRLPVTRAQDVAGPNAVLATDFGGGNYERNELTTPFARTPRFPKAVLQGAIPLLFEMLAEDIRIPQQWYEAFDHLVPNLLVRLPVWPRGRALRIDSAEGSVLTCSPGGSDRAPVRLYRQQGDYYGVEYGQPVSVRPDGDGFFRAMLISLGHDQVALVNGLSLEANHSERAVIECLRDRLAQYAGQHQAEVASVLQAWSTLGSSATR